MEGYSLAKYAYIFAIITNLKLNGKQLEKWISNIYVNDLKIDTKCYLKGYQILIIE